MVMLVMMLMVVILVIVVMVMLVVMLVVMSILTRHPSPHESVSGWVCPAASSRNRGGLLFLSQELERDYSSHKKSSQTRPSCQTIFSNCPLNFP